jgi:hypothetical protein
MASEFSDLKGEDAGEEIDTLTPWTNFLWVHPSIFGALKGAKSMIAAKAPMAIISQLQNVENDATTGATHNDDAKYSYHLLAYLWACCPGFNHPMIALADPAESESFDTTAQEVLTQLEPKCRVATNSPAGGLLPTDLAREMGEGAFMTLLIQNINAVTQSMLQVVAKEEKTKSMTS